MKVTDLLILCVLVTCSIHSIDAQDSSSIDIIIEKISNLESNKDPKCYATANRLEDFMYGTPLTEEARNLRIEVQKEVSLYIRTQASMYASSKNQPTISAEDIIKVVDSMAVVGRLKDGDYFYRIDSLTLRIRKIDFDQYSSVAYGLRSILSVEQDLIFVADDNLLSLSEPAVETLNGFLNLATLASLSAADMMAREQQMHEITEPLMRQSWMRVFSKPGNKRLFEFEYPRLVSSSGNNSVLQKVIQQKIDSYDRYNQLSASIFLRNIQVFFARQKWPTDETLSNELRNYFMESLIEFSKQLIKKSNEYSDSRKDVIIRIKDVQKALQLFMPFEVNDFEDVTFFPNDRNNRITIESYDLDAFRDGGMHWRILSYALDDPGIFQLLIDPTGAELIVEAVAQLGVLGLRVAGSLSHDRGNELLTIEDLEAGFQQIQLLIDNYASVTPEETRASAISSQASAPNSDQVRFIEVTDQVGIDFQQRSSDWLNRLIRSYVYSAEDSTAKLAIPPAFGGSGVAAEDVNNDGFTDVLLLGGAGNKLYLGNSSGSFRDISGQIPLNNWDEEKKSFGEPRQPVIADFNNDGLQDILMIYVDERHKMLKNLDGTHFEDLTETANLDGRGVVAGPATVLDYDNDGLLDIFIGYFGNYLRGVLPTLSRNNQNGSPNRLYRNPGEFRFQEVTFTVDSLTDNGWTQAAGHTDINQDGRQDLIVGNDFGVNRYYLNDKEKGFVEVSKALGTDKPSYTMNVGIGDLNNDQFPDLYISNIVVMQKEEKYVSPNAQTTMKFNPEKMDKIRTVEANDLFLSNTQAGSFKGYELSDDIGRGFSSTGWSWDADFFDFDNDGDEDLYCLNGMNDFRVYSTENPFYYGADDQHRDVTYAESERERNVFFVNENGTLINKAGELGADLLSNSRSAGYLDFDNDGDLDVIINNYHDKAVLLENENGNTNHWLKIKLVGDPASSVNLDAIGSSLILDSKSKKGQWREIHSTTGYLSVHPKVQHFGIGQDDEATLHIRWSNGVEKKIEGLQKNRNYVIKYPDIISY
ncbi:MAG: CRTAC1 family protein [Saprospiraceae bacterium]|nr:CRTAC1 family protein [Saprospiraceae bacterium]